MPTATCRNALRKIEESIAYASEIKIFDLIEPSMTQFSRQFFRVKVTDPWFSALSCPGCKAAQARTAIGRIVVQGFQIIEHNFGRRDIGHEIKRAKNRVAAQVHYDAQPNEDGRLVLLKSRRKQTICDILCLKICGGEF